MIKTRLLAGGAVLAIAAATVAAPASHAATSSGGSSETTTRVLDVVLGNGDLLALRLVGEEGSAQTTGTPKALARLRSFDVSSGSIGALNVNGPVAEASSGATQHVTPSTVDLAAPLGSPLPAGIVAGRIVPATLSATSDATGARSGLGAAIEQLSLAGGLVSAGSLRSTLTADASAVDAESVRGLRADGVRVVDLGALLQGLGIDLTDLPLHVVSDLLGRLGLSSGVSGAATLESVVGSLATTINGLKALLPTGTLTSAALGGGLPIGDVGGALGDVTASTGDAGSTIGTVAGTLTQQATDLLASVGLSGTATVQDLVDKVNALTTQLTETLTNAVKALDAAPLLSVDDVDVSVRTKAARTVVGAVSQVSATVGGLRVGGLMSAPALDLGAGTAAVTSVLASVQGALDQALATIDQRLAGVVRVTAFEKSGSVTPLEGGTRAVAALSALTATITPPADLAAIVQTIADGTGISELLAGAGIAVPSVDGAMSQLGSALSGLGASGLRAQALGLGALAQGATIRLGSVSAASTYGAALAAAPGSGSPGGNLPRTGSDLPDLGALGLLLIVLGLGLPVWFDQRRRLVGIRVHR